MFYGCAANAGATAHVKFPKSLSTITRERADEMPSLFYRALLPTGLVDIPQAPLHPDTLCAADPAAGEPPFPGTRDAPVSIYGDASGGRYGKDRRLRRIGWGAAIWRPGLTPGVDPISWGGYGALGGPVQSVNRGELWAVLQALERTTGHARLVTDSAYVVKGISKICARTPKALLRWASHLDLWSTLLRLIDTNAITLEVIKVESHLDEDEERRVFTGAEYRDIAGNMAADKLAGEGADIAELSIVVVSEVRSWDQLAAAVLRRNAAILTDAATVDRHSGRPAPQPKPLPRERLIRESQHQPVRLDGHWRCGRCHTVATQRGFTRWLATPCQQEGLAGFGNCVVDPSHTMSLWPEVQTWCCSVCGHYARDRAVCLAGPCGPPNRYGKQNLRLLERGLMLGGSAVAKAHNRGRRGRRSNRDTKAKPSVGRRPWRPVQRPAWKPADLGAALGSEPLDPEEGDPGSDASGEPSTAQALDIDPGVDVGRPPVAPRTEWVPTRLPQPPSFCDRRSRFRFA